MADEVSADLAQFKGSQRQVWEEGDYRPIGRMLEPAARLLVETAEVSAGQRVLDVATGSGSVALHAALAGAEVVGIDHTDAWFDEATRRADEAGVDITFEVGDAEDLPVPDGTFDVVLSGFGAIFAPRHDRVAAELARACRPGGTVALTAWTPTGPNDRMFSLIAERLPSPPGFVTPAVRWGDPDHVQERFRPHGVTFRFERPTLGVSFPSVEAYESFIFDNSGPIIGARRALDAMGEWEDTYRDLHETIVEVNEADDGSFRSTWDYLLAVGTKDG